MTDLIIEFSAPLLIGWFLVCVVIWAICAIGSEADDKADAFRIRRIK